MDTKKSKKKIIFLFVSILTIVVILFGSIGIFMYNLSPVDSDS